MELFLGVVNMSISASWLIAAVLALRFFTQKAPKWVNVLLWGIVGARLLLPFSIESALSLVPSRETIPQQVLTGPSFDIQTGIPSVDNRVNEYLGDRYFEGVTVPANNGVNVMTVLTIVWAVGVILMLLYTVVSYWRLRRRVGTAVCFRDNIFQSENIASPFVLGIIRPRIYLPFALEKAAFSHVVAHEMAHIQRRDHWWKPLGFLLLAIHWFNPLMWLGYMLLCRDIELACDEKVIGKLGKEQRADYTQALVSCSIDHRMIAACPLAFGEVGVRERVRSVLNYKKPAFWIVLLSVIACVIVAVCFLTDPVAKNTTLMGADYTVEEILYPAEDGEPEPPRQYCVTADYQLYFQRREGEGWEYVGGLTPYPLTNDELNEYMRETVKIKSITDAYILRINGDNFYLVFQTKDGKTYLAYGWEDISERGQAGSDDTNLRYLYRLESSFRSGHINVNFFQRSLLRAADGHVDCFSHYQSDDIQGYHIVGFRSGESSNNAEMTDLGFAVFQTNGEGYRLISSHVYENAVSEGNGIYFCGHPAVADINGEMRNDNTFDVIFVTNPNVETIERVYRAEDGGELVLTDSFVSAPYMSLWSWKKGEGYATVSQYFYDGEGNLVSTEEPVPPNSAKWEDLPMSSDEGKYMDLDEAISAALLSRYASDEPDGLIHVESHKLFANEVMSGEATFEAGDRGLEMTAYLVAYQAKYSVQNEALTLVTAWCIPTAITFTIGEGGEYVLKDYWEAPDGEAHAHALYNKFPPQVVDEVLSLDCMAELKAECEEKAYAVLNGISDGSENIAGSTRISSFTDIMGCDGYIISESIGEWSMRSYYAVVDGRQWLIAESFGFGEAKDYAVDWNGDGVTELATNVQYGGDGAARVYVYQRKGDTIYMGTFSTAGLLTFDNWGANAMWSEYDSGEGTFVLHFAQKGSNEYGVIKTTNPWSFEYLEYSVMPDEGAEYTANSVANVDIEYLLSQITSSPAHSSNPGDYIAEHQTEFEGLVDYGIHAIHYCFSEFLKGGQHGLRGHIMAAACREIAQAWGEGTLTMDALPFTGQQWFDTFKANALSLAEQYSAEELEALYPASYLLLIMLGE